MVEFAASVMVRRAAERMRIGVFLHLGCVVFMHSYIREICTRVFLFSTCSLAVTCEQSK